MQLVYGVDIPSSAEQICVEIDQTEPLSIPTRVVTESNRDQVIGTRGKQCTGHSMICAKDLRSGGPQNFDSECHMFEENGRGGRKCEKYFIFVILIYYPCSLRF